MALMAGREVKIPGLVSVHRLRVRNVTQTTILCDTTVLQICA